MHGLPAHSSDAIASRSAIPPAGGNLFAFVHIPKTAGTSVRQALEATLSNRLLVLERSENLFFIGYPRWSSVSVAVGHVSLPLFALFGAQRWGTCLRHPLARCVSQVQHWLRLSSLEPEVDRFGRVLPAFEPSRGVAWNMAMVLEWGDGDRFFEISNAMTYQLVDDPQFRVLPPDSHCQQMAIEVLQTASCLAVTENEAGLTRSLSAVLDVNAALGHANTSNSSSSELMEQLPRDVLRRLERANELDIALYEQALTMIGTQGWYGADAAQGPWSRLSRRFEPRNVRIVKRDFIGRVGGAPHELSGRAAHFLIDIAEFISGLSLSGDVHVFGRLCEADLAVFAATLGPEERLHQHGLHHPMSATEQSGARDEGHALPMRAALIQTKNDHAAVLAGVQQAALSLDRYGHALLMNALTGSSLEVAGEACKIFLRSGFSPLAVIDRHVLFCSLSLRPAMAALLKAKFGGCRAGRITIAGLSCLEITSDY